MDTSTEATTPAYAESMAFNFRQKPSGLFKRLLHAPAWLFRARLGFLFGRRIVMLEHRGRRSGLARYTPLEVVRRDGDRYILCSGTGPDADWYRNIKVNPPEALWVGAVRHPATVRFLDPSEGATVFAGYEAAHPKAASRLQALMGVSHDGTHEGRTRMVARIPMVELTLDPG
jgi:deazaflavin-dependent oxidoreductase (nitroreductase family)